MNADVKVTFRTPQPLSQGAGLKFWSHGSHFTAVTGRCTYQLTTRQSSGDQPSSLPEVVAAVSDLIEMIVAEEAFPWDGVAIDKITAEVVV